MKDRVLAFLQNENKSYAQFAEEIGVQPSGISHILSGRNNPSLDFVIKMLHRYPSLSAEWLLFGRGSMYREVSQPTLFDISGPSGQRATDDGYATAEAPQGPLETNPAPVSVPDVEDGYRTDGNDPETGSKRLTRIVFFYSDKTFTEYRPS